jgi:hypothetical protein
MAAFAFGGRVLTSKKDGRDCACKDMGLLRIGDHRLSLVRIAAFCPRGVHCRLSAGSR